MPPRRTEPSRSAVDQSAGFKYTRAQSTDLAKRFAAIRREQAKAQRDAAAAEFAQAQQSLELEPTAQVFPFFKQAV
ncbi:hypothetical protein ATN89_18605 [Comamonas thiooxydans]|uniref:hypothetical protein n=1 Tax=Comamonas thiooxydans TaxID=363952 RepID=UPI0007C4C7F4|nr:hypothetical protein [Comamonas thiooxydans]OAD82591.1 hypothetical protein ATN89_18605 [Comamonas thiooxydans]